MQLVAYGAQDIYLTGNPQITFFKVVYRRHTNFAMEAIEQTWSGSQITAGRCTSTISRNGDLVGRMYLELKGTTGSTINNGIESITDVEIEIGGQKIDKHTGQWMNVWAELTEPNPSARCGGSSGASTITGTLFQNMSGMGGCIAANNIASTVYNVPLQFWFCRNPGLALPLIALQYHEVKVILNQTFGAATTDFGDGVMTSNKLWCDYIYLDTDERRRFAQVSHEYLIEQLQYQSMTTAAGTTDLNFNHPVKELVWCKGDVTPGLATATSISSGTTGTYQLKLNGHDRFAARDYRYFSRTQVWQHHSGAGGLTSGSATSGLSSDGIGVYSFALKPEEHQPSGTCNFSRIDNAQIIAEGSNVAVNIFAVNYNVLRIMSGMGGLAYSN